MKEIHLEEQMDTMRDTMSQSKSKRPTCLYHTDVECRNELGELLFKKHNTILLGGRRFTLEKLFNATSGSSKVTLNDTLGIAIGEVADTTDESIPTLDFSTDIEKKRMSFTYYKNRTFIYSTKISGKDIAYIHFVYIKDDRIDYINDYAMIKYIKFKTESSYFNDIEGDGNSFITPNYNILLDFTNLNNSNITETDLERTIIDNNVLLHNSPDNDLPDWITTGFNSKYPLLSAYKRKEWGLTTTNYNLDSTNSDRWFKLNLTELRGSATIDITYRISTQSQSDYFAIHLTKSKETPNINSYKNRIKKDSGLRYSDKDKTVSTIIEQPGIYYLHFNFIKDAKGRSGYDSVMIKSIEIRG